MAAKLLLAGLLATAFLAVPLQAQAASAGFCAFGICQGVATPPPPVPLPVPLPPTACTNITPPPGTPGAMVVQVCAP